MASIRSNLDFGGVARAVNHPDPVSPQDVATRAFVLANVAPGPAGPAGPPGATGATGAAADYAVVKLIASYRA